MIFFPNNISQSTLRYSNQFICQIYQLFFLQAFFDYLSTTAFRHEGVVELEALRLRIPPSHILFFDTRLVHCGAEWTDSHSNGSEMLRYHCVFPQNHNVYDTNKAVIMHCCAGATDLDYCYAPILRLIA